MVSSSEDLQVEGLPGQEQVPDHPRQLNEMLSQNKKLKNQKIKKMRETRDEDLSLVAGHLNVRSQSSIKKAMS